jgi:hypothetical protein
MLHKCRNCPGEDGVATYLNTLDNLIEQEFVHFSQWTTTDRATMINCNEPIDEFIQNLAKQIFSLTTHHYITKSQSQYLKQLKQTLETDEAIVIGDFSENYTFIAQDASQSFHWTNSQVTLHPFIAYYKTDDGKLHHYSYCFISDCLEHTTFAVYTFQQLLIKKIKNKMNIGKIYYFSDGCGGQYKNYKNFINICHHEKDFGIKCEWNFFATSHGKNACDGIGGTIKRGVAKASLQRIQSDHILNPKAFYDFSKKHFQGIEILYVPKEEITQNKVSFLESRFAKALQVKGTRGFHKMIPLQTNVIQAFQTSESKEFKEFQICNLSEKENINYEISDLIEYIIGQYVTVMYDDKNWVGCIIDISEEHEDYEISFLHECNRPIATSNRYYFPEKVDTCWILKKDIICSLAEPIIIPGIKIMYSFNL